MNSVRTVLTTSGLPTEAPVGQGCASFACITQVPFDFLSWQELVAMNWPADSKGQPCELGSNCRYTSIIGVPDMSPRVWDYYKSKEDLIPASGKAPNPSFLGAPKPPPPVCPPRRMLNGMPVRVIHMMSKLATTRSAISVSRVESSFDRQFTELRTL